MAFNILTHLGNVPYLNTKPSVDTTTDLAKDHVQLIPFGKSVGYNKFGARVNVRKETNHS